MRPSVADARREQVQRVGNLLKAGLLDMARSVLPHACWSDCKHCSDTRLAQSAGGATCQSMTWLFMGSLHGCLLLHSGLLNIKRLPAVIYTPCAG